ncbi:MAG: hypothetical protein RLZ48_756 [Actinomycetota bacterium]|jgi:hypothetical protein
MRASSDIKYAEIRAVITRADGTREDLGQIAVYRPSFIKRALMALASLRHTKE